MFVAVERVRAEAHQDLVSSPSAGVRCAVPRSWWMATRRAWRRMIARPPALSRAHGPRSARGARRGGSGRRLARKLAAHAAFQVLCAVRRGRWGVDGLNCSIAEALVAEGLILPAREWYPGRPVLVTRNDHGPGLMNGDIGIVLPLPAVAGDGARTCGSRFLRLTEQRE